MDALKTYRQKRDFAKTAEPEGATPSLTPGALRFVVQKHAATRLHFDFRLELDGVLKSWAITRGPSADPKEKRLAVQVEDHPLDYAGFEGTIPKGSYGGGTVIVWDQGTWSPLIPGSDPHDGLAKGELKINLEGHRMKGGYVLIRLKPKPNDRTPNWLLIKERADEHARPGSAAALVEPDTSIVTGRTLEQVATGVKVERAPPPKTRKPSPVPLAGGGRGAAEPRARTATAFIPPQLCLSSDRAPTGHEWVHELKLDGYRMQAHVHAGRTTLYTRSGLDWTGRFPGAATGLARLTDCIVDGELCALDEHSRPDFAALQAAIERGTTGALVFFAFDLLAQGATELRSRPLLERKQALATLLDPAPEGVRYLEHFSAAGEAVLRSACQLGLEGVVSKKADAPYVSGRGAAWMKAKCRGRDEFVVGGWAHGPTGKAGGRLVLLVGAHRDGRFVYLGRVGSGIAEARADALLKLLEPLRRQTSPFTTTPSGAEAWVRATLVAEIEYEGFTGDGKLRQASFKAIREDKDAKDVEAPTEPTRVKDDPASPLPPREGPGEGEQHARPQARIVRPATPGLTHPEKLLWPEDDVTKQDLAAYYAAAAPRLLAYIAGRPISIVRAPDGITGQLFFQRHAMRGQSSLIHQVLIRSEKLPYLMVDTPEGLAALAQLGTAEIHPWGAPVADIEHPDRLIFDLDPAPDVPFTSVIDGAKEIRERLKALGFGSVCKTTGGKGLHVVVPITPTADWPTAKAFAKSLSDAMAADSPARYLATMSKKARTGRIFLDYLRNDRSSTAVAAWSPRARPGAPISFPVAWTQLTAKLDPASYTTRTAPTLLKKPDPWEDWEQMARPLP